MGVGGCVDVCICCLCRCVYVHVCVTCGMHVCCMVCVCGWGNERGWNRFHLLSISNAEMARA